MGVLKETYNSLNTVSIQDNSIVVYAKLRYFAFALDLAGPPRYMIRAQIYGKT